MSRNNKNAKRIQKAREITALHKKGEKGPSSTTPKHGKKRAWWQMFSSYSMYISSSRKRGLSGA